MFVITHNDLRKLKITNMVFCNLNINIIIEYFKYSDMYIYSEYY